jgi:pyrroline-5-carboxylate reductase
MMEKSAGIIGFGNMGHAVAEGIKSEYRVGIFDKDKQRLLQGQGLKVYSSAADLARDFPAIILAVKPQDFDILLEELTGLGDKLVISIAAGICAHHIENKLGKVRVIRTMPNMPAKIRCGITCLCKGKFATGDDLSFAKDIFKHIGEVLEMDESMMNAATAISGNGPAYVAFYLKAHNLGPDLSVERKNEFLADFSAAALGLRFSKDEARILTEKTFSGTIEYLKQTGISPQELMVKVASKGGSTESALKVLNAGGSLREAVKVGYLRAEGLSRRD